MTYPVRSVTRPAVLIGQRNGLLASSILTSVPGQAGGLDVLLVDPAARAWRALTAAALADGHVLKLSGAHCAYRPYAIQERIFRDRYTTTYLPGRPSKVWNGVRWWQRPGTAVAAVPGTSNHGWGLAVDTGEERDSDLAAEPLDDGTLRWLLANEERFGWSHEVQSEPWHLRYFAGDRIPKAVLDFEDGTHPAEPTEEVDDDMALIVKGDKSPRWWITDGLHKDYIEHPDRAAELAFTGLARWNDGGPFLVPQAMVDAIPVVNKPGNEPEIARQVLAGLGDANLSDEQVRSIIDAIPAQVKQALREGVG